MARKKKEEELGVDNIEAGANVPGTVAVGSEEAAPEVQPEQEQGPVEKLGLAVVLSKSLYAGSNDKLGSYVCLKLSDGTTTILSPEECAEASISVPKAEEPA